MIFFVIPYVLVAILAAGLIIGLFEIKSSNDDDVYWAFSHAVLWPLTLIKLMVYLIYYLCIMLYIVFTSWRF